MVDLQNGVLGQTAIKPATEHKRAVALAPVPRRLTAALTVSERHCRTDDVTLVLVHKVSCFFFSSILYSAVK